MKTSQGIKIIEFNARFGDPECINILSLLSTNILDIFKSIVDQTLDKIELKFLPDASVFKYLVPLGYPIKPVKDQEIKIKPGLVDKLIFSSITYDTQKGIYKELGSRTCGITALGMTIEQAANKVNITFKMIDGPLFYRRDIGINKKKIDYNSSGVDIDEGNKVIQQIKKSVTSTYNKHVKSDYGDYSGLIKVPKRFRKGYLVSTMDGVGTKSLLVLETYGPEEGYYMLGQDLVNHCINDTLVKGAIPLFFLDYYASNKISSEHVSYFVKGVADACREVNCVLIGGETAEMPDIYKENVCDLVGTMIGIVNKKGLINGKELIKEGNLVIGLPSSGPHTNGYSLIRKMLEEMKKNNKEIPERILKKLCNTHISYYKTIDELLRKSVRIHGLCHITGGGFVENPPRILPKNLVIEWKPFKLTEEFEFIKENCNLDMDEMKKVFNCGVGMLVIIPPEDINKINGISYNIMGKIVRK